VSRINVNLHLCGAEHEILVLLTAVKAAPDLSKAQLADKLNTTHVNIRKYLRTAIERGLICRQHDGDRYKTCYRLTVDGVRLIRNNVI